MAAPNRRQFLRGSLALASLGLVAGCGLLTRTVPPARMTRVGFLDIGSASRPGGPVDNFKQGMTDLGYVEGQQYTVVARSPEGNPEWLPDLAAELVRLSPDVIVAVATPAIAAAKTATGTIPIVMVGGASPVEAGFVASLARPGGNVTGLTTISRELDRKRLELLKETVPGLARVGVLWNPDVADREREFQVAEEAARALGLEVRSLEARDHGALEAAFERAAAERVDGLFLIDNTVLTANAPRIVEFARRHRLPMSSALRVQVAAGGLLAYGADRARRVPPHGGLRRPDPQGRQPRRDAGRAAHGIRARDQPRDRPRTGPDDPAVGAPAGHRRHPVGATRSAEIANAGSRGKAGEGKGGEARTSITCCPTWGETPHRCGASANRIAPTVEAGIRSVKRGENRVPSRAHRGAPGSRAATRRWSERAPHAVRAGWGRTHV